jgi:hypothetical protein
MNKQHQNSVYGVAVIFMSQCNKGSNYHITRVK